MCISVPLNFDLKDATYLFMLHLPLYQSLRTFIFFFCCCSFWNSRFFSNVTVSNILMWLMLTLEMLFCGKLSLSLKWKIQENCRPTKSKKMCVPLHMCWPSILLISAENWSFLTFSVYFSFNWENSRLLIAKFVCCL